MFVLVCQGVLEALLRKFWLGMLCRSRERFRHASRRAREAAPILVAGAKVGRETEQPMKEALHSKSPQAVSMPRGSRSAGSPLVA